jgi:spectinomycin phosphotransferase
MDKPNLSPAQIAANLLEQYGLDVMQITSLVYGADSAAAVYRVAARDGAVYFLKIRRGLFDDVSLSVLHFLRQRHITQIIAPIAAQNGRLWAQLDEGEFTATLYPFVEGHNGFEEALTDSQWHDLGKALKHIHTVALPGDLLQRLPRESYSRQWCAKVKVLLTRAEHETFVDQVASDVARFLTTKAEEILYLVRRTEQLGEVLQAQQPELVLCHSDIHAGNALIDASGRLYIIDWDNLILAPKERDLMFIGGGIGAIWSSPREESLFYGGYGQTEINPVALAYYRFARIVEDIALYGEQLVFTDTGGELRKRGVHLLDHFFQPHSVVAMAYQAEKKLQM